MKQLLSDKKAERVIRKAKAMLRDDVGEDAFDFEAEIDRGLSASEALSELALKMKQAGILEEKEPSKAEIEDKLEQIRDDNRKALDAEIDAHNARVRSDNREINQIMYPLHRVIEVTLKGTYSALILLGPTGIGKSTGVTVVANRIKKDVRVIAGKVTPAKLVEKLKECNEANVIPVFRDVKILENKDNLNILKAASDDVTGRIVSFESFGKQTAHLGNPFRMRVPFIIEVNSIAVGSLKEDLDALASKGKLFRWDLSFEDIIRIMRIKAVEEWQKEATEYIIERNSSFGKKVFNLRLQEEAFKVYEAAARDEKNWKDEVDLMINESLTEGQRLLYRLEGRKVGVRKSEFVKFVARSKNCTVRNAQYYVKNLIELEDVHENGSYVSLKKEE